MQLESFKYFWFIYWKTLKTQHLLPEEQMFPNIDTEIDKSDHWIAFDAEINMFYLMLAVKSNTVNFLNIRTPKKFVVISLKFELCGSTME